MSDTVQGRGHFLFGGVCPFFEGFLNVRWKRTSPISSDAKLAGRGQVLLRRPSALALWEYFVKDIKTTRGRHPIAFAVRIVDTCDP
eukprot:1156206-Pelagomonas_calceolata.AAC.2